MEILKKLGLKTILIVILSIALIISFIFGNKTNINNNSGEINRIHDENIKLSKINDSLVKSNIQLDKKLLLNNKKIEENDISIYNSQQEINKLKKRKNETHNYVNNMSAVSIANGLSDYLQNKSPSINK